MKATGLYNPGLQVSYLWADLQRNTKYDSEGYWLKVGPFKHQKDAFDYANMLLAQAHILPEQQKKLMKDELFKESYTGIMERTSKR